MSQKKNKSPKPVSENDLDRIFTAAVPQIPYLVKFLKQFSGEGKFTLEQTYTSVHLLMGVMAGILSKTHHNENVKQAKMKIDGHSKNFRAGYRAGRIHGKEFQVKMDEHVAEQTRPKIIIP